MHYYYDKDHYGKEHCYEIDDEDLRGDKEATLEKLAGDAMTVWEIDSWDDFDWDTECEENIYQVKAITDFLSGGTTFPIFLITHFTDDLQSKYECVGAESLIDYDLLITEYAGPHAYQIGPMYLAEDDFTCEEANQAGMYALGSLLSQNIPTTIEELIDTIDDIDVEIGDNNTVYERMQKAIQEYMQASNDNSVQKFLTWIMNKEETRKYIKKKLAGDFSIDDIKKLVNKINDSDKYTWVSYKEELRPLDIYQLRRFKHFLIEFLKEHAYD